MLLHTGSIAAVSGLCTDAVETRTPALGVDSHAVLAAGHLGVLVLKHVCRLRLHIHCGVQDSTGTPVYPS